MSSPTRAQQLAILRQTREATPPAQPLWSFKSRGNAQTASPAKARQGPAIRRYPCGGHGESHNEQGHSPAWDRQEDADLSHAEFARAQTRHRANKGCLYQIGKQRPSEDVFDPNFVQSDWKPGAGNQPVPLGGSLWGGNPPHTLHSKVKHCNLRPRREGWGGKKSKWDYLPVFVPKYGATKNGGIERLPPEQVHALEEAKKQELAAHREAARKTNSKPKQWLPAPTCFDAEAVTVGVGALGPIGRLEPCGWWVSRDPPVLSAPHYYHRDGRPDFT